MEDFEELLYLKLIIALKTNCGNCSSTKFSECISIVYNTGEQVRSYYWDASRLDVR